MNLKPGRYLDALVSKEIMGINIEWACCQGSLVPTVSGHLFFIKPYSTDMVYAWQVVEKLREQRIFISVGHSIDMSKTSDHGYVATAEFFTHNEHREIKKMAPTAPHAICLAALEFVKRNSR